MFIGKMIDGRPRSECLLMDFDKRLQGRNRPYLFLCQKLSRKNREGKLKEVSAAMDRWKRRHLTETIDIDIVKVIREVRGGR